MRLFLVVSNEELPIARRIKTKKCIGKVRMNRCFFTYNEINVFFTDLSFRQDIV